MQAHMKVSLPADQQITPNGKKRLVIGVVLMICGILLATCGLLLIRAGNTGIQEAGNKSQEDLETAIALYEETAGSVSLSDVFFSSGQRSSMASIKFRDSMAYGGIIITLLGFATLIAGISQIEPRIIKFLLDHAIIVGIVLIAIIVGAARANFISEPNFRNLLSNTAVRFIIAVGVSGCLITRGTDLSAGRVAGLAACISAILLQRTDYVNKFYKNLGDLPIVLVFLIVLAVCAFIGAVNGTVVSILKVPPFIATLGMQTLVYGICLVYTGAEPIGSLRQDYGNLATGYVGTRLFSYFAFIALAIGCLMWFLYNMTRHGKFMYAIGGNENAAEVAGVNVSKTKILIYMLAACLYGTCGFLLAARSGGASVNTAMGYELEAIAGCTIGGVSVSGGVGKISGILIGVLVFELLKIALQFLGVKTEYTYIVQGAVIITAVALDMRKYLAKK